MRRGGSRSPPRAARCALFHALLSERDKQGIEALRETAQYIFSTLPIVEREDVAAYGPPSFA
jgi:hypothetical protein